MKNEETSVSYQGNIYYLSPRLGLVLLFFFFFFFFFFVPKVVFWAELFKASLA